jgi:hypothetical protein
VAEFRICLQEALKQGGGSLMEWVGEPQLRAQLRGQQGWPVPDGIGHWQLKRREGAFFLEWDRGGEPLAVLTGKLAKYTRLHRTGGYRALVPGLGLRPRLVIVIGTPARARHLVHWLREHGEPAGGITVLVGLAAQVLAEPLGTVWWRSDTVAFGQRVA